MSATDTSRSRNAAPGCEAVTLIVPWDEVLEGDLVLHRGRLEVVEKIHQPGYPLGRLGIQIRGRRGATWVRPSNLTAVRRYTETAS